MSKTWKEVSWDEAVRDRRNLRIRIGDVVREVSDNDGSDSRVIFTLPGHNAWYESEIEHWGGVVEREVEEHPHGIVPQDVGTAIQFGDGRRAMRADRCRIGWVITEDYPSDYGWEDAETVQTLADRHGFTVLGDVEAAREEGRKAVLRVVYYLTDGRYGEHADQRIRDRFPEAFEGGESDD